MQQFDWFKPKPPAPLSLRDQVLQQIQQPITLGALSDLTHRPYRELSPILTQLKAERLITTGFRPVDGLYCLHYWRT